MLQSNNKKPAFRRGHFGPISDSILSVSRLISSMYSGLRILDSARSSSRVMRTLSVPFSTITRRYSAPLLNSLSAIFRLFAGEFWLGLPSCSNTIAARLLYSTEKAKAFKLGHYREFQQFDGGATYAVGGWQLLTLLEACVKFFSAKEQPLQPSTLVEAWRTLQNQIAEILAGHPVRCFDETMSAMDNAVKFFSAPPAMTAKCEFGCGPEQYDIRCKEHRPKTADDQLTDACNRIYARYGNDLQAFFADAKEAANKRPVEASPQLEQVARKIALACNEEIKDLLPHHATMIDVCAAMVLRKRHFPGSEGDSKQRQIDISNLRFYARMAAEFNWSTDVIHKSVIIQTLNSIADSLGAASPPVAAAETHKPECSVYWIANSGYGYPCNCVAEAAPLTPRKERPRIVVLCGSTRFYPYFQQANYNETMAGRIVLSIGFYPREGQHNESVGCTPEQKITLDELYFRKIELADEVLVLNVGGYIGESTAREIAYAKELGKPIRYLEPTGEKGAEE